MNATVNDTAKETEKETAQDREDAREDARADARAKANEAARAERVKDRDKDRADRADRAVQAEKDRAARTERAIRRAARVDPERAAARAARASRAGRGERSSREALNGEIGISGLGNRLLTKSQQATRDKEKDLAVRTTLGPRLRGEPVPPGHELGPELGSELGHELGPELRGPKASTSTKATTSTSPAEPEPALAVTEIEQALRESPTIHDALIKKELKRVPRPRVGALEILLRFEQNKPKPREKVVATLEDHLENPIENDE